MKSIVRRKPNRRGVEVVEFALVLPLIVLLLFGAIEAARAVMVIHALQEASHAACRVYSVKGTTQADAKSIVADALTRARITSYTVAFHPATKEEVDVSVEPVTVTVSASFANVAWLSPMFFRGKLLQGSSVFPADLNASDGGDTNGYDATSDDNIVDGNYRDDD
ncbi:MAG: TadE/TadG family type IV pilus assembly protein [Pirellula sp.]